MANLYNLTFRPAVFFVVTKFEAVHLSITDFVVTDTIDLPLTAVHTYMQWNLVPEIISLADLEFSVREKSTKRPDIPNRI